MGCREGQSSIPTFYSLIIQSVHFARIPQAWFSSQSFRLVMLVLEKKLSSDFVHLIPVVPTETLDSVEVPSAPVHELSGTGLGALGTRRRVGSCRGEVGTQGDLSDVRFPWPLCSLAGVVGARIRLCRGLLERSEMSALSGP